MISYKKLFVLLEKKGISTYVMQHEWEIGGTTLKRMKAGKPVSTKTLDKFCEYLGCKWDDIAEHIPQKGPEPRPEPRPEPLKPMREVPREFPARLQWLMQRDRMKQVDVVRATGLAPQMVSRYCLGQVRPNKASRAKLAKIFDVDIDWLMGEE